MYFGYYYVSRAEHVLWRIENGELEFRSNVAAIVLMVGSNNSDNANSQQIFEGILNLIKVIKDRLGNITLVMPVSIALK